MYRYRLIFEQQCISSVKWHVEVMSVGSRRFGERSERMTVPDSVMLPVAFTARIKVPPNSVQKLTRQTDEYERRQASVRL